MEKELLKKKVCETIDANKDKIYEIGHAIYNNPELGYKEVFTSELVKNTFEELGLKYEDGLGITGVKAKEIMDNFKSPYTSGKYDSIWEEIMGK